MLISGLWHGAGWTFVIWGGLHGGLIVLENLVNQWVRPKFSFIKLPQVIKTGLEIFFTFNLISFTWIFFRANSLGDALYILRHLFVNLRFSSTGLGSIMPGGKYELLIVVCAILLMEAVQFLQSRYPDLRARARQLPMWLRWAGYYGLVLAILVFGMFGLTEFIYVQF
jgi:D-alanyl-lipoteichoic acid acyltransferase DltB (MBOAT superfamily)